MIINDNLRKAICKSGLLTCSELSVFLALVSYADTKSYECFPSISELVETTQTSLSTVKRRLNSLVKKNVIKRAHQFRKDKSQTTNLYRVELGCEFWNVTEKSKKNKGRNLPSNTLYNHRTEVRDKTSVTVNDNISKANCQLFTTPEKHEKSIEKPKKLRNTVISEHEKNSQKNFEPQEKVSLEQIKIDFKYDELLKAAPARSEIIEPLFTVLYKVFNTPKNVIKINRNNVKPTEWVINRVKRLTLDNISEIIERIATGTEIIKNWGAYLLTCLTDFIDISSTNKQRKANAEMKQNTTTAPKPKLNKFHNFEERTDDLDALLSGARYKLGVEPGKASETPATPDITDYDAILRNKYAAFRIA